MKYIQDVGQRRWSSEVSRVPGVVSCDHNANSSYSGFGDMVGGGEGVCSARGSVKYHLPLWSEVDEEVGGTFFQRV